MCKVPNKYAVYALLALLVGVGSALGRPPEGYAEFTGFDAVIVGWFCGAVFFAILASCGWLFDHVANRALTRQIPFVLGCILMLIICLVCMVANTLALTAIQSWYGHITYLETGKVEAPNAVRP